MFYFSPGTLLPPLPFTSSIIMVTIMSGAFASKAANHPSSFPSASFDSFSSAVPVLPASVTPSTFAILPAPSGSLMTLINALFNIS